MDFINRFLYEMFPDLSEKSNLEFRKIIIKKRFKKGDVIVDLDEIPTNFYILTEGIIRSFTRDEKGKEYIRTLYVPLTTSGSLSSLIKQTPSKEIYECLTDCDILIGDYIAFLDLCKTHHDLALFYNKVLENIFLRVEKRVYQLSVLNATERYLMLKKEIPNIDNLIQQYHIASFLNITPVQLSRIRKELYSK